MNGRHRLRWALALVLGLTLGTAALATNGMYLEAYGSEAAGRGGANIAVADRALGLQANPAGIGQLIGNHFSVDLQFLVPSLNYSDPFGNDIDGEDNVFAMPSFSYVRGGSDTKWTWGIALVSQGGMGADFRGYTTPFGTTDKTFSEVRFATLIPTVAYSFTDNVSLGLSANLGYSDVAFEFWPDTSVFIPGGGPGGTDIAFAGADMSEAATTFNYALRLGLMWRITPKVQLGAIYQTETESDYDDGTMVLDYSGFGIPGVDKVAYDARVDGFTWPEQYGLGLQFRPTERLMLAVDFKRYLWSDAVSLITVEGSNPDNSMLPPLTAFQEPELPFTFLWEDQTVFALGIEHRLGQDATIRFGYNHGDSPVPDETLNPLFPATVEDHLTAGLGWNLQSWTMNFALSRGFENSQTNPTMNPMINPFGPGATVDHSQWTFSMGFTKTFARKKAGR